MFERHVTGTLPCWKLVELGDRKTVRTKQMSTSTTVSTSRNDEISSRQALQLEEAALKKIERTAKQSGTIS
jgi:hypothetical protein